MRISCCAPAALLAATTVLGLANSAQAQIGIAPAFLSEYSLAGLGSIPGVPINYGGLAFDPRDPDTLLIGGTANQISGLLYEIGVVRDEGGHVTGFQGTASVRAAAPYNDGGVAFHPSGVLFLARWPVNELAQLKPSSTTADKVIDMTPFAVPGSLSAFAFVPPGFAGAGRMKLVTFSGGNWFDAQVVPDGSGTFDLTDVEERTQLDGGPEGIAHVPPGSPLFEDYTSILVAEYGFGRISTYRLDAGGDPITATRADFVVQLSGAEGATVDPRTGDFLFSTFGGFNQVLAVRGFAAPPCSAPCGRPFDEERCLANAIYVLQASLELRDCPDCACDVDSSGTVTTTDALSILKDCAGLDVTLDCPGPGVAAIP